MAEIQATARSGPRLGRRLMLVGAGSTVALAAGMVVLALVTVRHVDAAIRTQAITDATHTAEFISRHLVRVLSAQARPDLAAAGGKWLEPLLQETVDGDFRIGYAMVLSPGSEVLAHSDPRRDHQPLPRSVVQAITAPVGTRPWQAEIDNPFHPGRVLDCSAPIMLGATVLGSVHVGIRLERLEQQRVQTERLVPAILGITGVTALLILGAALLVSWVAVENARRATQRLLRQQHRAEVGNLASGLVHEVRNPLNAMRMQLAVIRNRVGGGGGDRDRQIVTTTLEQLEGEVLRLQGLASAFLAYGRPASDVVETFEVRPVLQEITAFLEPEFEQAGMRVMLDADGNTEGLAVHMDRGKFRQVLLNLAANAREAMEQGGHLTIGLSRVGGHILVRIADTGVGIPADKLEHVFDLFYTTKAAGSGLGLAIVKQIVEDAGGKIVVASDVGAGTRFDILLPLAPGRRLWK